MDPFGLISLLVQGEKLEKERSWKGKGNKEERETMEGNEDGKVLSRLGMIFSHK